MYCCIFKSSNHGQVDFAGVCSNIEQKGGLYLKVSKTGGSGQIQMENKEIMNGHRLVKK